LLRPDVAAPKSGAGSKTARSRSVAATARSGYATDGWPCPQSPDWENSMRRWWFVILGLTACLAVCGGHIIVGCAPGPRIDRGACKQIQHDMTLAEVERIVGAAPGHYATQRPAYRIIAPAYPGVQREWDGDDGLLAVWFDENGMVRHKEFFVIPRGQE